MLIGTREDSGSPGIRSCRIFTKSCFVFFKIISFRSKFGRGYEYTKKTKKMDCADERRIHYVEELSGKSNKNFDENF